MRRLEFQIEKEELQQALTDVSRIILLEVLDESRIKLSSNSRESGRIEETQEILEMSGESDLRITLDARFLLDSLKVIEEDSVKISFSGEMKPILLEPVGNLQQLHLISPVRTN